MITLRNRFIALAYERISQAKPAIPMSSKTKETGVAYDPFWQQISSNWVSMHGNPHTVSLTLEAGWNHEHSTSEGYRAIGAKLAESVQALLKEQPLR
jgi:hypothetical protein